MFACAPSLMQNDPRSVASPRPPDAPSPALSHQDTSHTMTARDPSPAADSLLSSAAEAEADDRLVDALRGYRALLNIDPKHEAALLGIGRISLLFERYEEALLDFTSVLMRNPKSSEAYRGRGLCYLNQGLPDKALKDLALAITLDPLAVEPLLSHGQAALDLQLWDAAEHSLRAALAIDPLDPDVCLELARCLLIANRGDTPELEHLFSLITPSFDPDDGLLSLLRAELLARTGHVTTAMRLLARSLQLEPELSEEAFRFPAISTLLLSEDHE
jgi:tetratricopeptide (TPR) repeat protein